MLRDFIDGYVALVESQAQITSVVALRKDAYERSRQFRVSNSDAWAWTEADQKGYVLTVWDRYDSALATMHGIVVKTCAEAQDKLECSVTLPSSSFPSLVLERAATGRSSEQQGLNCLLRYHFIEAAIRHGLGSLTGAVFEEAPRLGTLADLGYEFSLAQRMWDRNFRDHTRVHVVALQKQQMPIASLKLRTQFESALPPLPWRGEPIQIPISPGARGSDVEP